MNMIEIYTDGACHGNPGPGGWGALLEIEGETRELFGGEPQTTNNRMEMMAAVQALQTLPIGSAVTLYTDSQYLRKGIDIWINAWKRNGWQTKQKNSVKNKDLWEKLDTLKSQHKIRWKWVKGHAKSVGNQRADQLAKIGLLTDGRRK